MTIKNICIVSMLFILMGCATRCGTSENAQKVSYGILSGFAGEELLSSESHFRKRAEILLAETIEEEFSEEEQYDLVLLLEDPSVQCLLYVDKELNEKVFLEAVEKIQAAKTDALLRLFSNEFLASFKRKIDAEYNGVMTFLDGYGDY